MADPFAGSLEKQRPDDDDDGHQEENRHHDLDRPFDASPDSAVGDPPVDQPDNSHGRHDRPLEATNGPNLAGIAFPEKRTEERVGIVPPGHRERKTHVVGAPADDDRIVELDAEHDKKHGPPTQPLPLGVDVTKRLGGRGLFVVPQREFQHKDRDTGCQQGYKIGDQEGAAAVFIGDVREPPDVAQAHRRTDCR